MEDIEKTQKSGSVLVIGGGIAGIQASLELANSGYKVYLLEKSPAIGGIMAQLDKTFPTNDCAMCIMSPKLVECGRHLNIELLTYSELEELTGEAGNFNIKIYKLPRFVDLEKCTGCGECEKVCPVEIISEFDETLINRRAIYRPYAQAFPNVFAIDKKQRPPCQIACPSGIHVQGYIALAREGKYKEAYDLIRQNNPFPSVCGRVCHHPCEDECRRGEYDEPIAIASIKRFIADYVSEHQEEFEDEITPVEKKDEKVAIIGAGPSGLTCAYYLSKLGYQVTVFEAMSKPGGMMRTGIPAYRLPRKELDWEIDQILKNGIELRTDTPIKSKEDFDKLRKQGYKAFFLSVGVQKAKALNIQGADLSGVLLGLEFLKSVNLGEHIKIGNKVAVIGGGNVAIDVAKCSLRLGAEQVHLFCLESRREMPAHDWEIEEALEEGVIIHPSWGPKRILEEQGQASKVEFIKCTSVFDDQGRFNPAFDKSIETSLDCDTVIIAIGQTADLSFLQGTGIEITPYKTIAVDPITMATNIEDIFAGGDIVKGPASVVEAVGQGYEAAISIDRFLKGENLAKGRGERPQELPLKKFPEFVEQKPRQKMPSLLPKERIKSFAEVELGFTEDSVQKETERCMECGLCSECLQCENVCEADAVMHSMLGETVEFNVGAVVVATGAEKFNPLMKHEYGYKRYANVITSIQFERVLAASGPYEGHLQRPSDGTVPKKIAWIQCVGSRTEDTKMPYCSSVCCMYAIKETIIAKEHVKTVEPTIFFMDIRAYGKDFDKFYDKAKEVGVRFIRARVGKIEEIKESGNLLVYYVQENGKLMIEEFDLVVLSVGFKTDLDDILEISDKLGVRLNSYNFIGSIGFSPIETTRPGVFICGPAVSPKDIPETVMQSSGAVAEAAELLADVRGTEIIEKKYPPEKDVIGQKPRIGVFVCHCGINIGSVVDVPAVVEYANTLPNVVYAEANLFTCSQDTQQRIKKMIEEHNLNRVVVASCSPTTHEPLFQETLREAGLNPYLFEMANIRNQCSWVHKDEPDKATEKSKTLVNIAVGKARLLEPLLTITLDVTQKGLVIGGGLAGMISALSIAKQGFEVALVERENNLGGNIRKLYYTADGNNVQEYLKELIHQVESNPHIKVYKNSNIKEIQGYIGNYKTIIKPNDSDAEEEYEHGIVVIATGANESKPNEYLYGENGDVITQLELEKNLVEQEDKYRKIKTVVMIQCVGSRDDEHPYCSRVCCTQAVKNAIRLKELNPKINIYILYRDVRTYGFFEKYYQQARDLGAIFIRYEEDEKPIVKSNEKGLTVEIKDRIIDKVLVIEPDQIVLAPAIIPQEDAFDLSQMLKIPLNEDNFFMEAHVKLRPVDLATEGIFLAGLAHSPKNIDETISQAKAAVERACTIISSDKYTAEANIATVNEEICAGCGICVSVCPYGAPDIVISNGRRVSQVNKALCKGCGSCACVCPSGAMQQYGFKETQTLAMVDEAL